ncbi:MAG TPA: hypothetical protein VGG83_08000 [Trebonia sp.]|jgi:hypothetical protein
MDRQPTLLGSCARAATAAEARFRINAPAFTQRCSRVIALDEQAADVVRELAERTWHGGHFLVFESEVPGDALLRLAAGGGQPAATALLSEELDGADTVVMVASAAGSPAAASLIGDAAAARGIMTAALVLAGAAPVDGAVAALRPNAMVLVVLASIADILEVLSALRI